MPLFSPKPFSQTLNKVGLESTLDFRLTLSSSIGSIWSQHSQRELRERGFKAFLPTSGSSPTSCSKTEVRITLFSCMPSVEPLNKICDSEYTWLTKVCRLS